jgi:hypothetical protein
VCDRERERERRGCDISVLKVGEKKQVLLSIELLSIHLVGQKNRENL